MLLAYPKQNTIGKRSPFIQSTQTWMVLTLFKTCFQPDSVVLRSCIPTTTSKMQFFWFCLRLEENAKPYPCSYRFPNAVVTYYHKPTRIKQHKCIISHFWMLEVGPEFHWAKTKVGKAVFAMEALEGKQFFSLF